MTHDTDELTDLRQQRQAAQEEFNRAYKFWCDAKEKLYRIDKAIAQEWWRKSGLIDHQ